MDFFYGKGDYNDDDEARKRRIFMIKNIAALIIGVVLAFIIALKSFISRGEVYGYNALAYRVAFNTFFSGVIGFSILVRILLVILSPVLKLVLILLPGIVKGLFLVSARCPSCGRVHVIYKWEKWESGPVCPCGYHFYFTDFR